MGIGMGILSAALATVYLALLVPLRNSRSRMRLYRDWPAPFMRLLERTGLFRRLQPYLHRNRIRLAVLEGECPPERLLRWTSEGVAMAFAGVWAGWLLAWLSDNSLVGWLGTVTGGSIPALRARDLNRRVERRRQMLIMELPVFLSRVLVLVNAGENVWKAMARSTGSRPERRHPLYDELQSALAAIRRGESMSFAMEEFGKRCAVTEAKLFAAVVLMNARRGGEAFVPALQDLTRQMWDKRKSAARTLGEQASSRLAFPLAVIFLLIILLVGAPVLIGM